MAMFDVDLSDTVAVVTGASRGAGRGTALVLGEAGATVYVTGRSVRGAPSGPGREGTIDETAEAVEARGGSGIPVRCDHTNDADVRSLFERVRREHGRLDLLVNNAGAATNNVPVSRRSRSSMRRFGSSRYGGGMACSPPGCAPTCWPAGTQRRC